MRWRRSRPRARRTLHYLTPAQVAAWKAAFKPLYKEAEGRVGKQIVDDLLKASRASRSERTSNSDCRGGRRSC